MLTPETQGPGSGERRDPDLLADPAYQWVEVPSELIRDALTLWLARFRDQPVLADRCSELRGVRRARIRAAFTFDSDFVRAGFELLSATGR